jgi:DNA-binding response OmpR family regulator
MTKPSGSRILVVDDSPFTGDVVAQVLRKAGFTVQVARDLWDLEQPDLPKPDLVLMDVVLSEAFGDDLAPLLRASHGFECPILLMSSLPETELAQRVEDAGLDGFVSKRGGVTAIVQRVREVLGSGADAPATGAAPESFEADAHQRLRRVVHVAGEAEHWNVAAIVAEMHALAGDADLAGATAIAQAARACRDVVREHGSGGWTPQVGSAIDALAEAIGGRLDKAPLAGKLLVVDATGFFREALFSAVDRAGYVVMEACTLAEARQKLHATGYDLILVDDALQRKEPSLVPELRGALPDVRLEIMGVMPLAKNLGATRLVEEIQRMVRRRS